MADNVRINEGTTTYIATDQVGTVQYQVIKLDVGGDGLSSPFTGTIGAVSNLAGGSVIVTAGTITPATGYECGTVAVGTAAVELTFTGVTKCIFVQADHDNTNDIFVGNSGLDVTGGSAIARLDAGEAISLEVNDASAALYVIGGATGQKAYKACLK